MQGATRLSLPEKIVRRPAHPLGQQHPEKTSEGYRVRALIDNICGAIHCLLSVEMRAPDCNGLFRFLVRPKPTVLTDKGS